MATRINVQGLRGMARTLEAASRGVPRSGPMGTWQRQAGVRFLAFLKRRYVRYSRGGGDWKPLAASTVRRRRKGARGRAAAGSAAILRDTGTLINALDRGRTGNVFKLIPGGVRVGFSKNEGHPTGKASIGDIAVFHNEGGRGGRPPKRPILVEPDQSTVDAIFADGRRHMLALLRKNRIRRGRR